MVLTLVGARKNALDGYISPRGYVDGNFWEMSSSLQSIVKHSILRDWIKG